MNRTELRTRSLRPRCDGCRERFDALSRWDRYGPCCKREPITEAIPDRVVDTSPRRVAGNSSPMRGGEPTPKATIVESRQLRASSRDARCSIEAPGVCCHDPARVVLAHLPSDIEGYKSTDLSACDCCDRCHALIDDRSRDGEWERDWYLRRAQTRTLTRMLDDGLIRVVGHDGERMNSPNLETTR